MLDGARPYICTRAIGRLWNDFDFMKVRNDFEPFGRHDDWWCSIESLSEVIGKRKCKRNSNWVERDMRYLFLVETEFGAHNSTSKRNWHINEIARNANWLQLLSVSVWCLHHVTLSAGLLCEIAMVYRAPIAKTKYSKIWRPLIKNIAMRCRRRLNRRRRPTFGRRAAGVGAANRNVHIYCRRPFIKHISGRTRHSIGCKRIVHDLIENYTMCFCWLRLRLDFRLVSVRHISPNQWKWNEKGLRRHRLGSSHNACLCMGVSAQDTIRRRRGAQYFIMATIQIECYEWNAMHTFRQYKCSWCEWMFAIQRVNYIRRSFWLY